MGALIAFGFYRLGDFVVDRYRRKQSHHSALVKREWLFNSYHSQLRYLLTQIADFEKAVAAGHIHHGRFRPLAVDETSYLGLLDTGLINTLFSLNGRLFAVNHSLEDVYGGYVELKHALLATQIVRSDFDLNATMLVSQMHKIGREIDGLLPDVQRVHARIRLQAHRDTPRMWIAVNLPKIATLTDGEIDAENSKLSAELKASEEASRKAIEGRQGSQP